MLLDGEKCYWMVMFESLHESSKSRTMTWPFVNYYWSERVLAPTDCISYYTPLLTYIIYLITNNLNNSLVYSYIRHLPVVLIYVELYGHASVTACNNKEDIMIIVPSYLNGSK